MKYFVTAVGTDSGKTLASAILCKALKADYWKPVQAGFPRDTDTVQSLLPPGTTVFHPERFVLAKPVSPHAAARAEGITIHLNDFSLPDTSNPLVVEGAGGLLVPLSDELLVVDLIAYLGLEVILVSNHYLGSINHTLLSAEALMRRNISVKGIIFNGDSSPETEDIILRRTSWPCLLRISREKIITTETITAYASRLKQSIDGRSVNH